MNKSLLVFCVLVMLGFSMFHGMQVGAEVNPFVSYDKEFFEAARKAGEVYEGSTERVGSFRLHSKEKNVLVKIKDEVSLHDLSNSLLGIDFSFIGRSQDRILKLKESEFKKFSDTFGEFIDFYEPDRQRELMLVPDDVYYESQWALKMLNFDKAWDITKGSKDVKVAVLDTGITREHNDVANDNILQGVDIVNGGGPVRNDYHGHGTATAGIIGATTNNGNGIAGGLWEVSVVPIKVSNGSTIVSSDIMDGLAYALESGCKIVNLSLGSYYSSPFEQYYINKMKAEGCIIIASAGNSGEDEYSYPASYDNVISVGACKKNGEIAKFSQLNDSVDLAAPGYRVWVPSIREFSGYELFSGTSFSAPYTASVVALMLAINPEFTYDDLIKSLPYICNDKGEKGYDVFYGNGIIDAEKAVRYVAVNQGLITPSPKPPAPAPKPKGIINSVKFVKAKKAQKIVVSWNIGAQVQLFIKNNKNKKVSVLHSKKEKLGSKRKVFYWKRNNKKKKPVAKGKYVVVLKVGKHTTTRKFKVK